MNQEPRWVLLVKKSIGQKSRATVPLMESIFNDVCQGFHAYLSNYM